MANNAERIEDGGRRVQDANGRRTWLSSQSHKTIPQLRVSLQDLTYCPVTATALSSKSKANAKANATATATATASATATSVEKNTKKNKNHRTIVLDSVTTEIRPFELTAWMGPSGSGKTSLVSVVAGLVDPSDIVSNSGSATRNNNNNNTNSNSNSNSNNTGDSGGCIRVNDEEGSIPKQMVGVVWQDDLLLSNLTVEETIYFAARLKTPRRISDADVHRLVEDTMEELGLLHVRHRPIGGGNNNGQPKISGGERKRTAVAVELVVRPPLLLLDEPTSGLDATTAHSLMKTLRDLVALGHSIAVVIHQPRTDIFNTLDRLLLLSKGRVVYDGATSEARAYLEGLPSVGALPPETGIADWIMDTIIRDEQQQQLLVVGSGTDVGSKRSSSSSLADYWTNRNRSKSLRGNGDNESEEGKTSRNSNSNSKNSNLFSLSQYKKSHNINGNGDNYSNHHDHDHNNSPYEASFWRELTMLLHRISKQQRGDKLTLVSGLLTTAYLVFTSFLYWRLPDDTSNVYERNSLLFFVLIAQGNGIVTASISVFHHEKALLKRERAQKMYRVLPFFLAKVASDATNNILLPLLYGIVVYWTAGLRPSMGHFGKFLLGFYGTLSCAQNMGFFLSILFPDLQMAMILVPPLTLFMFIAAGFYIPFNSMNVGMKWLSYLSFARYGYSGLLINEFRDREIPCSNYNNGGDGDGDGDSAQGITFGSSSGSGSGSGNDTNDMCPMQGSLVYESMGLEGIFASYWVNIGVLAVFQLMFLVGAYALLRRSK